MRPQIVSVWCDIYDYYIISKYVETNNVDMNEVILSAIKRQLEQEITTIPPLNITRKSKLVTIRIPYDLNRKLKKYAKKYEMKPSKVIRIAIRNYANLIKNEMKITDEEIINAIKKKNITIVTFKIPEDLYRQLFMIAKKHETSVSEIIREAIKKMLKNENNSQEKKPS